jgi:hypothetical protein
MTLHATCKNSQSLNRILAPIDLESQETRHRIHHELGDVLNGFREWQGHNPTLRLLCTFTRLIGGGRLSVRSVATL